MYSPSSVSHSRGSSSTPGLRVYRVRCPWAHVSLAGGLLLMTQTRRRDWPSRTEREEPFSRAVGAGEKETEGQRDQQTERNWKDMKRDRVRGQGNRGKMKCRKRRTFSPWWWERALVHPPCRTTWPHFSTWKECKSYILLLGTFPTDIRTHSCEK